jgi:hypothetical protein
MADCMSLPIQLNFRVLTGVGCTRAATINNFFILLTFTIKRRLGTTPLNLVSDKGLNQPVLEAPNLVCVHVKIYRLSVTLSK